jgi:LytS/YehU family sensor histidine kinase
LLVVVGLGHLPQGYLVVVVGGTTAQVLLVAQIITGCQQGRVQLVRLLVVQAQVLVVVGTVVAILLMVVTVFLVVVLQGTGEEMVEVVMLGVGQAAILLVLLVVRGVAQ